MNQLEQENKQLRENLKSWQRYAKKTQAKNEDISDENKQLKKKISELQVEIDYLNLLPADALTFDRLRRWFGTPYTIQDMPDEAGIYGYIHQENKDIYVGQSVNMNRRLKQHIQSGKIEVSETNKPFDDGSGWTYHVLDFIDRDDKQALDDREAYWIAIAKVAISEKHIVDTEKMNHALSGDNTTVDFVDTVQSGGRVTNKTRGNNIKL